MDTASDLSLAASNGDFERVRELVLADTGISRVLTDFRITRKIFAMHVHDVVREFSAYS